MVGTVAARLAIDLLDITGVKAMDATLGSKDENPARARQIKTVLTASKMAMQGYPEGTVVVTLHWGLFASDLARGRACPRARPYICQLTACQ